MTVVLPALAAALLGFASVALAVLRWPRPAAGSSPGELDRARARAAAFLRRRIDPDLATGLALTAAGVGLLAVGFLLVMVRAELGLARLDRGASSWAAERASDAGIAVLRLVTHLGATVGVVTLAVIVLVTAHRRLPLRPAATLVVVVLAGQAALSNGIKALVDRARPDLAPLADHASSSFPSGHATAAAAGFAVFALLLGRGRSRPVKAALAGGAAAIAWAVAATRVLLGVHWLTDALAGLALGWAWFALCSLAFGGGLLSFGAPLERVDAGASPFPAGGGRRYRQIRPTYRGGPP